LSDSSSNILLYLSGHGGHDFLKFQDSEELSSFDLANTIQQMYTQHRYQHILLIADTCQAESLHQHLTSPNVISIAASRIGENSYSHDIDAERGLATSDRFTLEINRFFQRHSHFNSHDWLHRKSLADLFLSLNPQLLLSNPTVRTDLYTVDQNQTHKYNNHIDKLKQIQLAAFFAANTPIQLIQQTHTYPLTQHMNVVLHISDGDESDEYEDESESSSQSISSVGVTNVINSAYTVFTRSFHVALSNSSCCFLCFSLGSVMFLFPVAAVFIGVVCFYMDINKFPFTISSHPSTAI